MKTCLSAKKERPQQVKMKTCDADAKDMKGDAEVHVGVPEEDSLRVARPRTCP